MENIKGFSDFVFEGKVTEKAGISPAIFKDLQAYFSSTPKPTLSGAQSYISKKKGGWKLSKEDFDEAVKKFKK